MEQLGFIVADYLSSVETTDIGITTLLKFVYDENTPPIQSHHFMVVTLGCDFWRFGVIPPCLRFDSTWSVRFRLGAQFILHLYFTDNLTVYAGTWSIINLASHPSPIIFALHFYCFLSNIRNPLAFFHHTHWTVLLYYVGHAIRTDEVDRCGHTCFSIYLFLSSRFVSSFSVLSYALDVCFFLHVVCKLFGFS